MNHPLYKRHLYSRKIILNPFFNHSDVEAVRVQFSSWDFLVCKRTIEDSLAYAYERLFMLMNDYERLFPKAMLETATITALTIKEVLNLKNSLKIRIEVIDEPEAGECREIIINTCFDIIKNCKDQNIVKNACAILKSIGDHSYERFSS